MPEVADRYAGIAALVPPVWRSLPWGTLGAAFGLGPALIAVVRLMPGEYGSAFAVMLLRVTALALALGLAFLLDDPARHITAAVPTRRAVRSGVRMVLVAPFAALSWTAALLLVPAQIRPPAGDLTLEAAALAALALAGAASAVRFTDRSRPGAAVAAVLLTVTLLAPLLPEPEALFTAAGTPGWAAAHQRWAALLTLTLLTGAALLPEPLRRYRVPARAHR